MKKKQSKGRQKRRMTELDIRMVVEEIEAWRNGDRGSKFTWGKLERIFPFTRQTMYSKVQIRNAFLSARTKMRSDLGSTQKKLPVNSGDLENMRLRKRIIELEKQVEEFQRLWIERKI